MSTNTSTSPNGDAWPWLSALDDLVASNHLRLIKRADPDFEPTNLCYIQRPTCKPAAIVRPKSAEDVSALIKFCTSHSAPFVVRTGGHDSSGRTQVAGALSIDMREMDHVTISADRTTAKVAGGTLTGPLSDILGKEGLVTPIGMISTVGYVGWATGAGYGPFAKSFGLGVDQIVAAKLVNWEGNIIDADEELLKGIRGAGPTFGSVVELTIKVYPLDTVLSGILVYETREFESTVDQWFSTFNRLSDEAGIPPHLTVHFVVTQTPELGRVVATIVAWTSPDQEKGRRWIDKVVGFGNCIMNTVAPVKVLDYLRTNDQLIAYGSWGHNNTASVRAFTPKVGAIIKKYTDRLPGPGVGFCNHLLSGPSIEPRENSIFGTRAEHIVLEILSTTTDEAKAEDCMAWGKAFRKELLEHAADDIVGAGFPALLTAEDSDLRKIYGSNYEELIRLKQKYDPHNVFRNSIPRVGLT